MKPEIKNALKVLADYCQNHYCENCDLENYCAYIGGKGSIFATYDLLFGDDQE